MADKKVQRSNMTQTDASGKVLRAPKSDGLDEIKNFRWWLKDEDEDVARAVANTIAFIQRHQSSRMEQLTVSTRNYGNSSVFSALGTAFTRASSVASNPQSQRITFNLCASVIDTLVSKMSKNKVVPTFVTNGGVWTVQQKAQKLSKFLEGCFHAHKVHLKTMEVFRDACVWGDGFLHVYRDQDEICVERVLPHEIFVDMIETLTNEPQQLHRVKIADRDIVLAAFGDTEEKKKAIMEALPPNYQDLGGSGTAVDLVQLTESWHLPSSKEAQDGLHVICLGEHILFKEEWKKDYFPFVHLSYSKKLLGYFSQGACERLQSLQGEVNRLMILIQKSMWMGGSFKVLIENGSKVVSQHLNNDVGAIIHYTGTPPQYVTPPMIQQDIYPYVDSLIAKGFQQEGVSQLSASALKPMGLDSGKALRTMTNLEDDRFLNLGQRIEESILELGKQMIQVAKEIFKDKKSYKTVFPSTTFMEEIDWADIKLEDDEYVLKAFPISSLPEEPAERFQTIQEYAQAGWISPRAARRLMSMPDIEMADNLANAQEDLLHKVFEEMLEEGGKKKQVEPYMDLELAKELCVEYLNFADCHNAPKECIDRLKAFNNSIDSTMAKANSAMQVQAQQTLPQANPAPAPQSNLIPNSPNPVTPQAA